MRKLTTTLCLILFVLLESVGCYSRPTYAPAQNKLTTLETAYLRAGRHQWRAGYKKGLVAYRRGDYATAIRKFESIAKLGDFDAQHLLGRIYRRGPPIFRDYKTAVKWFRLAAEQGHVSAQANLGEMYLNGKGVPQNDKAALKWFRLTARTNKFAQYSLHRLEKKIAEANVSPPPPKVRSGPSPSRKSDPNKIVAASSGTGFAVSPDGHVITNNHVINGCKQAKIHHEGQSIPVRCLTSAPTGQIEVIA